VAQAILPVRLSAAFARFRTQQFDSKEHRQDCLRHEMPEKLAIRKCFLVCCQEVSSISNPGRRAIRNCGKYGRGLAMAGFCVVIGEL
jgi:hypothetical protein